MITKPNISFSGINFLTTTTFFRHVIHPKSKVSNMLPTTLSTSTSTKIPNLLKCTLKDYIEKKNAL
jgi:hypothetical protein